jgi:transcriptional regulator with XRE-family HTH domain
MRSVRLGEKLSLLRKDRAYAEVAKAVGCSAPTVRDIEAGRTLDPSISIVRGFAELYGVSLDWLADDSADWPPPATPQQSAEQIVRQALERGGLAGELSEDERAVVSAMRRLDDSARTRLVGYVDALAAMPPAASGTASEAARQAEASLRRQLQEAQTILTERKRRRGAG